MLDVLGEVPDYSFIAHVMHEPPNPKPPILINGAWTFPCDKHEWLFPCETCHRTILKSVDQSVRQASIMIRGGVMNNAFAKFAQPGKAFRLLTDLLSNPIKLACTAEDCTTPDVLESKKYIVTLWAGNAATSFKVCFRSR